MSSASHLHISDRISLSYDEIELHAVRSQGAGGQNLNQVATAVPLRFDIAASSLPMDLKERLLKRKDRRITREGVIVIKAQLYVRKNDIGEETFDLFNRVIERGDIIGIGGHPFRTKLGEP